MGIARDKIFISSWSDASTHFLEAPNKMNAAIVTLFDHKPERELIYALLVHEAVHIWQEIKKLIGEEHPSKEFEAYSMQAITQELFVEYQRQVGL